MTKTILHLCADTGSDSLPYQNDSDYDVIVIGSDIGVENYSPDRPIHGIMANPVCTEFSSLRRQNNNGGTVRESNPDTGMFLVNECMRIIQEANPSWWTMENPANGTLGQYIGKPRYRYQPWWYGSPWTKATALWGQFNIPVAGVHYHQREWSELAPIPEMWVRRDREKPSLAHQHKSIFKHIPEFRDSGMSAPQTDAELRSLCSQRFAEAFKNANP